MIINNDKNLNISGNINYFIGLYKRKIMVLKYFVTITNIIFPTIALFLVIISTFNIAGEGHETSITGNNYVIFSAMISGIVALINSLVSFFLLKEKITNYNAIYYQLIIEKQKYELNGGQYFNLKEVEEKQKVFENQLFTIITGYNQESQEEK
jgi:hypothetical protein